MSLVVPCLTTRYSTERESDPARLDITAARCRPRTDLFPPHHHIISTNQGPAFHQAALSLVRQISGVNDSRMEPGVFLPAINKCDVKSYLRVAKKIITPQEVKK